MSEGPILQLSPAPAAPEVNPSAATDSIQQSKPAPETAPPTLDDSQLTDAERKAIDG